MHIKCQKKHTFIYVNMYFLQRKIDFMCKKYNNEKAIFITKYNFLDYQSIF